MKSSKTFLLLILIFILVIGGAASAALANGQSTCLEGPVAGGIWYKIDSGDLSTYPVAGATQYCFKFGSDNSQGCDGGISDVWPPPANEFPNPCGLSHWSYFIPDSPPVCEPPLIPSEPDCGEWTFEGDFKKCQTCTTYYTDSSGNDCGSSSVTQCLVFACIEDENVWVPEDEYEGPIGPCGEPEYEAYCTIDGQTVWIEVGSEPPEGAEPGECEPPTPWVKPPPKVCPNKCSGGACIWENVFGETGVSCADENLYGTDPGGILAAWIIADCNVVGFRCEFERYIVAYTRTDIVSEFTIMDGFPFASPEAHQGADGNDWILYINGVGEDRTLFNSWDGWWIVSDPEVPVYPYRPCCLAASYAFTKECEDGSGFCAIRIPGVCSNAWWEFFLKSGIMVEADEETFDAWYKEFHETIPLMGEFPLP